MKNLNDENGRSMIEMLGVLAIIGVLSVGGIAGYSKAMMKYRINKTIEQITLIAGNIRAFFAPQKNFNGLICGNGCSSGFCYVNEGCNVVKKAKIVPDEMIKLNSDNEIIGIDNAFGGYVGIEHNNSSSQPKSFKLLFTDIPQEACIEILSQNWNDLKITHICSSDHNRPPECALTPVDFDDILSLCDYDYALYLGFECGSAQDIDEDASMM